MGEVLSNIFSHESIDRVVEEETVSSTCFHAPECCHMLCSITFVNNWLRVMLVVSWRG